MRKELDRRANKRSERADTARTNNGITGHKGNAFMRARARALRSKNSRGLSERVGVELKVRYNAVARYTRFTMCIYDCGGPLSSDAIVYLITEWYK